MATVVDLFYGDTYMMIPCMEIKGSVHLAQKIWPLIFEGACLSDLV